VTNVVAATCPHCAAPVDPAHLFCEECGSELTPDAAAVTPPAPPGAPAPGEEIGGLGGASAVLDAALEEVRSAADATVPVGPPRRPGVHVVDADLDRLPTTCSVCPGTIAPDGYCSECGTPATRPRDHWAEQPAPWVALVCDRGLRHSINQDAGAIGATAEAGGFVAMVICDGVSSAARSEVASLAAARAARDVLVAPRQPVGEPVGPPVPAQPSSPEATEAPPSEVPGTTGPPDGSPPVAVEEPAAEEPAAGEAPITGWVPADDAVPAEGAVPVDDAVPAEPGSEAPVGSTHVQSRSSALAAAIRESGAAAQAQALAAASEPPEPNPPACTFVAAVLDSSTVVVGWVGDSRAYWIPDDGLPWQLSTDDSWAAEAMAIGFTREEAEHAPQAHSITRWLGMDAPDAVPRTVARRLETPGWLLLCSDGLWNYRSEAADLRDLVRATATETGAEPMALAEALVAWANAQGGHDNITVALARVG